MNYATLVTDLETWTENFGTEFIAALPEIVRKTEDLIYHSVQLPAWRQNTTLTTTISTRLLTAPTDFLSLSSLAVVSTAGLTLPLLLKDLTFIREAFPDDTVLGVPRVYALYDKTTLMLAPTPSAAFSVKTAYFAKPESIVTASTSWIGDNAESVLFYGCLSEAYTYMKGDPELQGRYRAMFDEGLARLKELGQGKLKADDFRLDRNRA